MRSFVRFKEQQRLGQMGESLIGLFNLPFFDHESTPDLERRPSQLAVRASQDITALAKRLQYNIAPTTTRALSNKDIIESEVQIIERLRSVPRADLSRIITHLNFSQLIFNVRDHFRFSDKKHKEALLDVLCVERLHALDPPARAAVLNALQVSETIRSHPRGQEWARHVICHSESTHLNLMKLLLDNTGTYHNLHKLVYYDVTDPMIRESIIRHIRTQALLLRDGMGDEGEYMLLKASGDQLPSNHVHKDTDLPFADVTVRARRHQAPNIKIFSDVDDTLYCSGGDGIAGVDASFPRKQIYPGVLEFYKQMDIGPNDESGNWNTGRMGNLVFLSARPHVYKDVAERASYNLFKKMRSERGLYCNATMLAGQVSMETMRSMNLELGGKGLHLAKFTSIMNKKLSNYEEFSDLYPEYNAVFIGDNGQGDVMVVQKAIEAKRPVIGAFIHHIIPIEKTFGYEEGSKEKWDSQGICFFTTYVGAAVAAFERGLISVSGLENVARKARAELVATLEKTPLTGRSGWPPETRRAWCEKFNDDLILANEHLPFDEIEEVPLPEVVTPLVALAVDTLTEGAPTRTEGSATAQSLAPTDIATSTIVSEAALATTKIQDAVERAAEATVAKEGAVLNETEKAAVRNEVLMAVKDVLMTLLPKRYSSGQINSADADTVDTETNTSLEPVSDSGVSMCTTLDGIQTESTKIATNTTSTAVGEETRNELPATDSSKSLLGGVTPSTTPRDVESGDEGARVNALTYASNRNDICESVDAAINGDTVDTIDKNAADSVSRCVSGGIDKGVSGITDNSVAGIVDEVVSRSEDEASSIVDEAVSGGAREGVGGGLVERDERLELNMELPQSAGDTTNQVGSEVASNNSEESVELPAAVGEKVDMPVSMGEFSTNVAKNLMTVQDGPAPP
eukprot:CFRG8499T1